METIPAWNLGEVKSKKVFLEVLKLLLDGVISRSPHGRTDDMFGPVVTTEAQLAFSCARIHSNNTADMTAMIEALSFLGPRGPVARDEQSCGNLGNECADALGTFGLISIHNVATRWIHHNFDAAVCFDGCDNISEVLERLRHIRTNATSFRQDRG